MRDCSRAGLFSKFLTAVATLSSVFEAIFFAEGTHQFVRLCILGILTQWTGSSDGFGLTVNKGTNLNRPLCGCLDCNM